jgi:hypothetical protein
LPLGIHILEEKIECCRWLAEVYYLAGSRCAQRRGRKAIRVRFEILDMNAEYDLVARAESNVCVGEVD